MMGIGSFGSECSSSSSNLSALAQPFKVDRFITKPNSSAVVQLSEAHFAAPFNPSISNQNSNFGLQFHFNPVSKISSSDLPYTNTIQTPVSQPIHLPSTLSPLNPKPITDPLSYAKCSDSLIMSAVQTKSYYSQYAPPAIWDNNPLATLTESDYELLCTSSVTSLNGSYHDGYSQSLPGLEYPGSLGGFRNGLEDELGCEFVNIDQNFSGKGDSIINSSACNKFTEQAVIATEGLIGCEETRVIVDNIDTLGNSTCNESFNTWGRFDDSLGANAVPNSLEPSRTSVLGSPFIFSQPYPEASSLDSFTNIFNHQNSYNALRKKASPAVIIRPPTSGSNLSIGKSHSSKKVSLAGSVSVSYDEELAGLTPIQKGSHLVRSCEKKEICLDINPSGVDIDRNAPILLESCELENKELYNSFVTTKEVSQGSKTCSEPHVSLIKDLGNLSLSVSAGTNNSLENSCESPDSYYPAVDSPCWKGAQSSRCFVFDASDDTPPVMKEFETCHDTVKISAQNPTECTADREVDFLHIDSLHSPRDALVDNSSSIVQKLYPSANCGFDEVIQGSLAQSYVRKHPSCFSCSPEDTCVRQASLQDKESTPKMNSHVLVDAISNLSELLLFHCSNEACALKEHDLEALKLVINNLDACLSKNAGLFSQKQELPTKQGAFKFVQHLSNLDKGVTVGKPLTMKVVDASVKEQHADEVMKIQSCPVKDVKDMKKDDATTKVIKQILEENLENEEEKNPHAQLYRNLWLEAEAALCSINYKARFDRVRSEMEKIMLAKGRGGDEENNGGMGEKIGSGDNAEASVMARFHVLKCRGEQMKGWNDGAGDCRGGSVPT